MVLAKAVRVLVVGDKGGAMEGWEEGSIPGDNGMRVLVRINAPGTGRKPEDDSESQEKEAAENKWLGRDRREDLKEESQELWGPKKAGAGQDLQERDTQGTQTHDIPQSDNSHGMIQCGKCGLHNHETKDCRRVMCELCGLSNHSIFDCKKGIPWNFGPELCVAQVEDQSFFYIDECIDSRVAQEKASIAVISVISGIVTAKQIELEFMNLIGVNAW